MDNIRVFTGAESPLHDHGFNGSGIVGEVKDSGLDQEHVEFQGQLLATDGNVDEDTHGTSTFGIVFARGANARAKGMLPGAKGVFASWGVGRKQSIANLVNRWDGVFQSNSWSAGSADGSYGSNSRQNDEAVFDYDATMLYATGNGGSEGSISQEAAAKNVIGVGAFNHYNNKDRSDDRHTGNQGNRGPTADGRIKPDVVGPYDSIYTTTTNDRYTSGFGGTSGATPVAAGAVGLIYEMYREDHFGNNPTGILPHAATVKAILIADAYQYEFSQGNRYAQGWGLVDVGNVYNIGENHLIDDQNNALQTGETIKYNINPIADTPLKISLVWTDVPGTASSSRHLINDLNLMVTDPNGMKYYGNYGLDTSKWSQSGGEIDYINNVENVFIENPIPGGWTIEVEGWNIPLDGNVDTREIDQSFALVASGVAKYEHDLRVQSMGYPKFVGVEENVPINATIMNIGSNHEKNVKVEFLVDNTVVGTTFIDSVDVAETEKTNFFWRPSEARIYNISIHVEPVAGETSIWDNRRDDIITVNTISGKVLVDDGHGTDLGYHIYYQHLESMGAERYRVYHTAQKITTELLSQYDVFLTVRPTQAYSTDEITSIENFVAKGGGLLVIGENDRDIYNVLTDYAGIDWGTPYRLPYSGETSEINYHEITENVNTLYFDSPRLPLITSPPAEEIVYTYGGILYNRLTVAVSEYGFGRVVAIADVECLNSQFIHEVDNIILGKNIIRWLNNREPVSIIDSPQNNSKYDLTDEIQFDGSSSYDPDKDILSYLWSSDISGEIGSTASFITELTPGQHTITLEVKDGSGKIGKAEIRLWVLSPPSIELKHPSKNSLLNGIIEVSGTASDPDSFIQKVEVKVDKDSWQEANDISASKDWSTWTFSLDSRKISDGSHTISAKSMDDDGYNSSVDRVSITIDNTPPRISEGPEVYDITSNEATIAWETDEPTNSIVEYGTDLKFDYSVGNESYVTKHIFVLTGLLPKTTYQFRVKSADTVGNEPTIIEDMTFETDLPPDFTPPNAIITYPQDDEVLNGDILITADVSDNYGIAKVEFYIDNILKFTGAAPDYYWLWDSANGNYPDGQYTIKVLATDLRGNEASDLVTVTLDNVVIPPSIFKTRVNPDTVTSGESADVLFTVEISDPENRLERITIDIASLGGSAIQKMYDDGRNGDEDAGDHVYSFEATVPSEISEGEKSITIIITYDSGETIETSVILYIDSAKADRVSDVMSFIEGPYFWLFIIIIIAIFWVAAGVVAISNKRHRSFSDAIEVVPLDDSDY
jgi:hypothetical protein